MRTLITTPVYRYLVTVFIKEFGYNVPILSPLSVVSAPTATTPHHVCPRQGFRCTTARLQDESKSDPSSPSSSSSSGYHEHYQAPSAEHDTAAASQDNSASYSTAEDASRPNTRLVKDKQVVMVTKCCTASTCGFNRHIFWANICMFEPKPWLGGSGWG